MKEIPFELAILFDCYGGMLTEKQRACFELYYNQDYSLSEIAEDMGISRQGVHDSLAKAENALREMEQQLHCGEREKIIKSVVQEIRTIAGLLGENSRELAERLDRAAAELEKE